MSYTNFGLFQKPIGKLRQLTNTVVARHFYKVSALWMDWWRFVHIGLLIFNIPVPVQVAPTELDLVLLYMHLIISQNGAFIVNTH